MKLTSLPYRDFIDPQHLPYERMLRNFLHGAGTTTLCKGLQQMPITQDWKSLGAALEGGVKELLNELIDGSIKDLNGPIREIAARLTLAAKRKRKDLVDECRDQLALIILEKELRLKAGAGDLWEKMLGIGLNALVNGAIGGLGVLRAL